MWPLLNLRHLGSILTRVFIFQMHDKTFFQKVSGVLQNEWISLTLLLAEFTIDQRLLFSFCLKSYSNRSEDI